MLQLHLLRFFFSWNAEFWLLSGWEVSDVLIYAIITTDMISLKVQMTYLNQACPKDIIVYLEGKIV